MAKGKGPKGAPKKSKDFQKVKFKVGKKKPKGQNATNTDFKSRAVTIHDQFHAPSSSVTSSRGLGIHEICSKLSSDKYNQRQFALTELADYVVQHPQSIPQHLADLLNGLLPRLFDDDERNRSRVIPILTSITSCLGSKAKSYFHSFSSLIISYTISAISHVNDGVFAAGMEFISLLPTILDLNDALTEAFGLLDALILSLCSMEETKKKSASYFKVILNPVGRNATKSARMRVFARMVRLVEELFPVDEAGQQNLKQEDNIWNIREPNGLVMKSRFEIEMDYRPVVWSFGGYQEPASDDRQENTLPEHQQIYFLRRLLALCLAYWPTTIDQESDFMSFFDAVGRRCCQDIVKRLLKWSTKLLQTSSLPESQLSMISESFLEMIKELTSNYPFDQPGWPGGVKQVDLRKAADIAQRLHTAGDNHLNGKDARIVLLTNLKDLLCAYRAFAPAAGASDALKQKIESEISKAELSLLRSDI